MNGVSEVGSIDTTTRRQQQFIDWLVPRTQYRHHRDLDLDFDPSADNRRTAGVATRKQNDG